MSYGKVFQGEPIDGERADVSYRGRVYSLYRTGYVYFATFEARQDDLVKIGWSQNPWWRVYDLGLQLRERLRIVHLVGIRRGSKLWGTSYDSLESRLHRFCFRSRVNPKTGEPWPTGEWYRLTHSEVTQIVGVACTVAEQEAA